MKRKQRPPMGKGIFYLLLGSFFYAIVSGQFQGSGGNLFLVFAGGLFLALFLLTGVEWAVYPGSFILTTGAAVYMAVQDINFDLYWPLYILLPGLGFFLVRVLTPHNRWATAPGAAAALSALFFFLVNFGLFPPAASVYMPYLPPVLFFLWGLKLILFPRK